MQKPAFRFVRPCFVKRYFFENESRTNLEQRSNKAGSKMSESAKVGKHRQSSAKGGNVILPTLFCATFASPTPDKGLAQRIVTHKKQKSWEHTTKEF